MGSGTTGVVAVLNDKNYIGFELNEEYAGLCKKRIDVAVEEVAHKSPNALEDVLY